MTEAAAFEVTDKAARRIVEVLKTEGPGMMLRIAVSGGGCSGFQYNFTFDNARQEDDLAVEKSGATVLIDATSLEYVKGARLDFVEEMVGSSFQIKNPNATASCGCGSSFSVM
ncbi:MAG: iron-sulfur cluster insertion protein ErpA [Alphaproteobacteria bacterium]|nr:iron-sulfur cluster insertion protein ErpA [Alphaproteobacteria bacterium]